MNYNTQNNFDLIRLFAAAQVALTHAAKYFNIKSQFFDILGLFPGVPIFFFVSGYLIYGSYKQSTKSKYTNLNFFIKRFFRLYPALWLCFFFSIISIWSTGYFREVEFSTFEFLSWAIAHNTIFQFYHPDFMRNYGVGVLNGSLWSISVEIQFYLLTPFIFYFINRYKLGLVWVIVLILIFTNVLDANINDRINIYKKLLSVSFLPWLYMFILGAIAYKFSSVTKLVTKVHVLIVIGIYILSYILSRDFIWGNLNPISVSYLMMPMLILKIAYTAPQLSDKILKKNDISYGLYIFHMPIINYFLHQQITGLAGFFLTILLTVTIASISWFFYEKKILSFKKYALRKN